MVSEAEEVMKNQPEMVARLTAKEANLVNGLNLEGQIYAGLDNSFMFFPLFLNVFGAMCYHDYLILCNITHCTFFLNVFLIANYFYILHLIIAAKLVLIYHPFLRGMKGRIN